MFDNDTYFIAELGPFQFKVIIKEDGQITFIYKKVLINHFIIFTLQ